MDAYIAPINRISSRIKQRILAENGIRSRHYAINPDGSTRESNAQMASHAIRAARPGGPKADKAAHFPTLIDGLKGVEFIEAVVRSSGRGGRWVRLPSAR